MLRGQQVAVPRIIQHYALDYICLQDQILLYTSLQVQYPYTHVSVLRKYVCSLSVSTLIYYQNCEGYSFNFLLLSVHI
jgi:hypothetical protein